MADVVGRGRRAAAAGVTAAGVTSGEPMRNESRLRDWHAGHWPRLGIRWNRRPSLAVDAPLRFTICLVVLLGYGHVYAEDGDGKPGEAAPRSDETCRASPPLSRAFGRQCLQQPRTFMPHIRFAPVETWLGRHDPRRSRVSRDVAGVAAESCSDRAGCIEGVTGGSVAIILVGDDTKLEDDGTHPRLTVAEGDEVTGQDDEGTGAAIDVPGKTAGNVGSCDGRRFKKCR